MLITLAVSLYSMALEDGTIQFPQERPEWGPQMNKLCTKSGIEALERALATFAPHATSSLMENTALNLQVRAAANADINYAVQGFISRIYEKFVNKGILTKDILDIASYINWGINAKYPEGNIDGNPFGEAFILNEVESRVKEYFIALIALKERAHRIRMSKYTPKTNRRGFMQPQIFPTHGGFFRVIDTSGAEETLFPDNPANTNLLRDSKAIFLAAKYIWIPFLQGPDIQNPDSKTKDILRTENDAIGREILSRRKKKIPMCTIEDDTILPQEIIIHFAPIEPNLHTFHNFLADVHLLGKDIGQVVAQSREAQESLKTRAGARRDIGIGAVDSSAGIFPQVCIDRFHGNLHGLNMSCEALRLIAGNTPNYELLRRKILWYLAQLTCRQGDVEEIFNVIFQKKTQPHSQQTSTGSHPSGSGISDRRYPDERQIEDDVADSIEIMRRKTTVHGHTRLLPIMRRPDGKVTVCQPSQKAIALARAEGITLERGLELTDGTVFYPEDVRRFLEGRRVNTIEEVITANPGEIFERYETWVETHERGDETQGVTKTIRAQVKDTI